MGLIPINGLTFFKHIYLPKKNVSKYFLTKYIEIYRIILGKCNLNGYKIIHVLKPILMKYTNKLPFSGRQKVHRTMT
jgi:hypothetical protein